MGIPGKRSMVVACLLLAGVARAQGPDQWNGVKVVTRYARALRGQEGTVEDGTKFRIYIVKKVEEDRVTVESGPVRGWFLAADVVPLDKAVEFYTGEIEALPNNYAALNWRGMIYKELDEVDKAIADFTEAIKIGRESAHPFNNRGNAWTAKKEYDKAIADFDEAIRIKPDHAMAYSNRARAHRKLGHYDRTLADFDEAIRLDPKFASAHNGRAWMLATCPEDRFRDGEKAVASATTACELTAWKDAHIIDTLAAAYAEMGYYEQATRRQQEAVDKVGMANPIRKEFVAHLALYKKKKPCREE